MKCVVCKGSDIELKTVDEQIRTEKDIILVPMTILVCSNCGERYYDRKSMRQKFTNCKNTPSPLMPACACPHADRGEGWGEGAPPLCPLPRGERNISFYRRSIISLQISVIEV